MSISYPPIVIAGGLSAVYTSGSITGSGQTGNEIRLKDHISVVAITASYVSASELLLENNPYATTGGVSASFAKLNGGNVFTGGANEFELLTAHNTVTVDGTLNSNYAYLHIQGTQESRLRIRKGFTECGSIYNSSDVTPKLVIEGNNGLILTGSTAVTGNISLVGATINANPKISVSSGTGIVDTVTGSTRTARYTAMVETTTGDYHVQSADLLLANNGSTLLITPYAVTCTSGSYLALFDAQYNGSDIEIVVNKLISDNLAVTMTKTYLS